ncbi:dihydrofolate reductase family protein [Streptomyces sp. HMX112]|uniref:dihydrofolate reductase family protein n=1 Tax=Streptomyces sp. HMX112 TaxID=3390850 RepID=UPI003A7FAC98
MTLPWTDDINAYVDALTAPVDCLVLGRGLAEGFIPTWAAGPEGEDRAAVDKMNGTPKVVISAPHRITLGQHRRRRRPRPHGARAEGPARRGHDRLRRRHLVSSLIAEGLLDELHLFVSPTAIGAGTPVFADLGTHQRLRLAGARPFDCGITAPHYEPRRA